MTVATQAAPPPAAAAAKVYLKNLNGLRFLAAMIVVVHHLEQIKSLVGWPSAWHHPVIEAMGGLAVTFFFVLSGYLITYLLLCEKAWTGRVDVGRFYMRRVLRIWPLYFLITLIAFAIVPALPFLASPFAPVGDAHFGWKLALFLAFLPNLALVLFAPVPYASHAWSIGVEEQFYLVWPLLLARARRTVVVMAVVLVGLVALKWGLHMGYRLSPGFPGLAQAIQYMAHTRLDCMAIGGLLAYAMWREGAAWRRLVFHPAVQGGAACLLVALLALHVPMGMFKHEIFAVLFGLLIANVSLNPRTRVNLEHPVLTYLGNISYGVYMYHILAIGLAVALIKALGLPTAGPTLAVLAVPMCLAISALSYELFEKRILTFKATFATVASGEQARDDAPRRAA